MNIMTSELSLEEKLRRSYRVTNPLEESFSRVKLKLPKPQTKLPPKLQLIHDLYKHQNFKCSEVLKKVDFAPYSPETVRCLFSALRQYLKTGHKRVSIGSNWFQLIDNCKAQCIQPLVPKKSEAVRDRNFHKSERKDFRNSTKLKQDVVTQKLDNQATKFGDKLQSQIALQLADCSLVLFSSEEERAGYLRCLNHYGISATKVDKGVYVSSEVSL